MLLTCRLIVIALMCCTLAGCSKSESLQRAEVSGTVTWKDQPIEDGEIVFTPDESTKAPPGSGVIKDGKYQLVGRSALVNGTYSVQIRAFGKELSKELSPGGLDRPQSVGISNKEQILPEKFNTKSTIEKVTINGTAPVTKNFDLKE
ncbi:MAG: hypothetical protein IT428_03270 [Planctomycetaceae bacterium]|nr:hypothetical protein [Planctomycetaceae bacterium]